LGDACATPVKVERRANDFGFEKARAPYDEAADAEVNETIAARA
jgi:hypothetical protein